jgi:hypothetical protein
MVEKKQLFSTVYRQRLHIKYLLDETGLEIACLYEFKINLLKFVQDIGILTVDPNIGIDPKIDPIISVLTVKINSGSFNYDIFSVNTGPED